MAYHKYKNKSGGYYRGRSRCGRYYTRQGCYIATSVYGSYDCPEVWVLRRFRDYKLDETWCGRVFIRCYYAFSPIVVKIFGDNKNFKLFWKKRLDTLVNTLQDKGYENTKYQDRY